MALRSDATITNKFGTSEHPNLIISCTASGYLFVYVAFNNFVTANGLVGYTFDGGAGPPAARAAVRARLEQTASQR